MSKVQDLLVGLVSIPSVSGSEKRAVNWLVEQMAQLGFQAQVDPAGNAVGTIGDGAHEIMLLGHIDTVPGEIPVRVEDGILHGRGSVDAKGPLATFVAAAARAQLPPDVRVTVVGAVGEESFGSPGATWLRDNHPAPDAVVIGEPGGWDGVVLGYKGSVGFTATVERSLSHSAGPETTAPETLFRFWAGVSSWLDEVNQGVAPGFNSLDGALRAINTEDNGFIESAKMSVTFRLPPEMHSSLVYEHVDEIAAAHDVQLVWVHNAEAFRIERTSPIVAPFLSAIRAAGGRPRIKVKTGTADMNIVGPAWGCPILAYGPGDASYDHRPDEQIALDEVERATGILSHALERLAGRVSTSKKTHETTNSSAAVKSLAADDGGE